MDEFGKLAIKPQFGIDVFQSGPNPVTEAYMYDAARDFSEGLAAVQFSAHHWGFVDKAGTTVIDGPFDVANSFHEGLAAVKDAKTGKWGFIRR